MASSIRVSKEPNGMLKLFNFFVSVVFNYLVLDRVRLWFLVDDGNFGFLGLFCTSSDISSFPSLLFQFFFSLEKNRLFGC